MKSTPKPKRARSSSHASAAAGESQESPDVVAFLAALEHPRKDDIEVVRRLILAVDPTIREAIKWNAPSFRTTEFFATFHLRSKEHVQLVFHTGAKAKATATTGFPIDDPAGLLRWLAKDRGLVTLKGPKDIAAHRSALEDIVRQWIRWV